jgi:potassium-transporting ATPase ATP-binding subunit
MSTIATAPSLAEARTARRASRTQGLFAPDLVQAALKQAFAMLRPDVQWKNPVMFVVEVGTVLSILYTVAKIIDPPAYKPTVLYLIALDAWLFLTVLFANFAEALAEARGKAQAESLRKTRQETPAFRLRNRDDAQAALSANISTLVESTVSTALVEGDLIVVDAGQLIPGDGEIVAGVASVDESAITGSSKSASNS